MNTRAFLSTLLTLLIVLPSRCYADEERRRRQGLPSFVSDIFKRSGGGPQFSLQANAEYTDISGPPGERGPFGLSGRGPSGLTGNRPLGLSANSSPGLNSDTSLGLESTRPNSANGRPSNNDGFVGSTFYETENQNNFNNNGGQYAGSITRSTSNYGTSESSDMIDLNRRQTVNNGQYNSGSYQTETNIDRHLNNDQYNSGSIHTLNNDGGYRTVTSTKPTSNVRPSIGDRHNSGSHQTGNQNTGKINGNRPSSPTRPSSSIRPPSDDRFNSGSHQTGNNNGGYRPSSSTRPSATARPSNDDRYNSGSHQSGSQNTGQNNGGYHFGLSTKPTSSSRPLSSDRYNSGSHSNENENKNNNYRPVSSTKPSSNLRPSSNGGSTSSGFIDSDNLNNFNNNGGRRPGQSSSHAGSASGDKRPSDYSDNYNRPGSRKENTPTSPSRHVDSQRPSQGSSNGHNGSPNNNGRPSTGRPGYHETSTENHFNNDRYDNGRPGKPSNNQNESPDYNNRRTSNGGRPLNNDGGFDRPESQYSKNENSFNYENGPEKSNRFPSNNQRNPSSQSNNAKCSKKNEFLCESGECLPIRMRCDSRVDCRDSSDEADCVIESDRTTASNRNSNGKENKESEKTGCFLPSQPDGGNYELGGCDSPCNKEPGDKVPRNSILNYTCRDGYVLDGNTISVCVNDEWYKPPTCLKTCSPLKSTTVDITCMYQGSVVSCDEPIMPGTRANLACKHSYKLPVTNDPAYREIECLEEGLWDRTIFRCLPECGTAIARGNTLVVNGFDAKVGVFPWHVGIYSKNYQGRYEQICGGTLIANNLVLSAAHCFFDESTNKVRDESKFAVAVGKHSRSWYKDENYQQKAFVEQIELTDRYIGARGNFAQDIALLKLKKPLDLTALVRPICLDWDNTYEREQLQVGQTGKAVGWGKTQDGIASESLQEINLPFVPYDQCLSAVPTDFRGYITSDKFCAGYLNGSSLCEGDSGGGLCFKMNGIWYLRGVISVSPVKDDSCDYNSYVGFTYVSFFRDWIRTHYVNS